MFIVLGFNCATKASRKRHFGLIRRMLFVAGNVVFLLSSWKAVFDYERGRLLIFLVLPLRYTYALYYSVIGRCVEVLQHPS